jgi:hypothetical protein
VLNYKKSRGGSPTNISETHLEMRYLVFDSDLRHSTSHVVDEQHQLKNEEAKYAKCSEQ